MPIHTVHRHCRRNRIFRETCDNLPYATDAGALETENTAEHADLEIQHPEDDHEIPVPTSHQHSVGSRLWLTSELDQAQHVLTLTGQYFEWNFQDHWKFTVLADSRPNIQCPDPAHLQDSVANYREIHRGAMSAQVQTFFNRIGQGLDLLVANQPQAAWKMIHEGCNMVREVFHNQTAKSDQDVLPHAFGCSLEKLQILRLILQSFSLPQLCVERDFGATAPTFYHYAALSESECVPRVQPSGISCHYGHLGVLRWGVWSRDTWPQTSPIAKPS